jgi:hypothetical protein
MVVVSVAIVVVGSVEVPTDDAESDEESVQAASTAAPDTTMKERREKRGIVTLEKLLTYTATIVAIRPASTTVAVDVATRGRRR